jgi:predicted TIM-barrel fold metal-dependent hydrolase
MGQEVIDIHLHFGAPSGPGSGCYWSKEFERGLAFLAMRLVTRSLCRHITLQSATEHILEVINGSRFVHKSVVLALDEAYDDQGRPHPEQTHLYVPNGYLAGLAKDNTRVLFGASVHPFRPDWEDELQKCLAEGCVLCKWIPSSQQIDPSHPRCLPFYRRLRDEQLPLLCHVGPEGAIPPFDLASQGLNSPRLLRSALEAGVTVIAAHAALPLLPPPLESDRYYRELIDLFLEGEPKGWNLYADLSAINLGPRMSYIDRVKVDIPPERLVFGSDYPLPILDISQRPRLSLWQRLKYFLQTIAAKNPLDKNYLLIKNMEFDEALFTNASKILRLPEPPRAAPIA